MEESTAGNGPGAAASIDDDDGRDDVPKRVRSPENEPSSMRMRRRPRSNGCAEIETATGWRGSLAVAPSSLYDNLEGGDPPNDDEKEGGKSTVDEEEPLSMPESTHSFLFTEAVGSRPFLFSVGVVVISITCLALALIHNIKNLDVPKNVDLTVKIAQYMAILIALLMEEEIPTGLYLLRRIQQPYLKKAFPAIQYSRFVATAVLRILMGYAFLANVTLVLILADGVIDIFYDVLALQFIQQLDDIGFSLCKIDVLGKRLQRATRTTFFQYEFVKQKEKSKQFHACGIFLKAIYFFNLMVFLAIMSVATVRQMRGFYQCDSITFLVGDDVWDEAFADFAMSPSENDPGMNRLEMKLVYSYFNGVYVQDGTSNGRPIYLEQRKTDHLPFDVDMSPALDGMQFNPIPPAEIRYCDGRWIFTHKNIFKSRLAKENEKEDACRWLMRSPKDDGFDLLDVTGNWDLWAGVISNTEVSIECNACEDDSDCNLNGICTEGACECKVEEDVTFLGTHCESKLKEKCRTIISEVDGGAWDIQHPEWMYSNGYDQNVLQMYSRPSYLYRAGTATSDGNEAFIHEPAEGDSFELVYSGLRWYVMRLPQTLTDDPTSNDYWEWITMNYHAFWMDAYSYYSYGTLFVSDPTTADTPVGVDFHRIRARGEQFGPFGFTVPVQPAGRGLFRCEGDPAPCSFCIDGLTEPSDKITDPVHRFHTCGYFYEISQILKEGDASCTYANFFEPSCCPTVTDSKEVACSFCSNGTIAEGDPFVPDIVGNDWMTCSNFTKFSFQFKKSDSICEEYLPQEALCCPTEGQEEPSICTFCQDGITADEEYIVPQSDGLTCSDLKDFTLTLKQIDGLCKQIQEAEQVCCSSP